MNRERRKRIEKVIDTLETAQYEVEEIRDEEQEALDNLPEGIQLSERGDEMQDNIDDLDNAGSDFLILIGDLRSVLDR